MSEQIITILLSTLLGGVLTIAGGLVVNYVNHRQTTTDAKRKELREVIEKIYKLTLDIDSLYVKAYGHIDDNEELLNMVKFLSDSSHDIIMLVSLYAPELANETETYRKTLKPSLLKDFITRKLEKEEYSKQCMAIYKENIKYRRQLSAFLRKNGK